METARIPAAFLPDIEKAVEVLRTFGTKEVYLFGSLASRGLEHEPDLVDLDHERPLASFLKETNRLVRIDAF